MRRVSSPDLDDPDNENALRVTQSVAIVRQLPMVLVGNGLTSIIISLALSTSYSFVERLPLVIGMWTLLLPVAYSWWRLHRRAVPKVVSRKRILKLTLYSGLIGWYWTACMLWYFPGVPPEIFAFLITGCGFLTASSATILYMVPAACVLYAVPMMAATMYLATRSNSISSTSLMMTVSLMTTAISWMLFANWKNFRTLFMLSRERELHAQKEARATLERSEFLENFSHEIRTPLTSIVGFAQLLDQADHTLSPEMTQYARNIVTAGDAMRILLNDLLDIARLDVDHLKIQATPCQLGELLRNAIALTTLEADKKKLPIRLLISHDVPDCLYVDSYRLRQVVLNLLSNAVKFTEQGRVDVLVSWKPGITDDGVLQIKVADTGPGMLPLDENHRFKRFSRLTSAASGNRDGAGLGLFISQELILRMGGELQLKSQAGYGSVFVITLALKTANAPTVAIPSAPVATIDLAAPAPPTPAASAAADMMQILIADDMPMNRQLLRRILEAAGHTVMEAPDGTQAVEACRLQKFDLIFMDIEMPDIDGVEVTHTLRRQCPHNQRTPVVAVTGHVGFNQLAEFREAGIDDCLHKPLSRSALLEMVGRWQHRESHASAMLLH